MHSLPLFHRIAGQTVIVVGMGDAADAKRRLVERAGGVVVTDPEADARLAFVALDEPEQAAAALKARGVLVNVVDRPDLCDFTTPSLLERGAVLVAIGTGGLSAGLAKAVRLRIEEFLPATLGALAEAIGSARDRIKAKWPDPAQRRRALDAAVSEGGPLDLLRGETDVAAWLASGDARRAPTLEFTAPADADDLTLRQARALGTADTVLYEAGVADAILVRARADAVRRLIEPGAKLPSATGATVIIRRG